MNANLYISSDPELEAELNHKIDAMQAKLNDLVNAKAEAKTQGEKISLGFQIKKAQAHLDSYKADLKSEVKYTIDQEAAVEYILQSLADEIDKTRTHIQNWVSDLTVDNLQSRLEWAEKIAKTTQELEVLCGLMYRFWTAQGDVSTTMTMSQMQNIAEAYGKAVQEEALRACHANHSTSMWGNAMEMAQADVNAHYSSSWSWANVVSNIHYFAVEASKEA